jgi:galactokinase
VVELLRAGRPADVGPELTASHASLRDDFEVSVPALDAVVGTALAEGALGARLVGGGFGGSVLVLARVSDTARIGEAVVRRAAAAGHPEPVVRAVHPAGGARREPSSAEDRG